MFALFVARVPSAELKKNIMCFHHILHFAFCMLHAYHNMHNAHSTQYTTTECCRYFSIFHFTTVFLFLSYFVYSINSTEVSIIIAKTCFQHFLSWRKLSEYYTYTPYTACTTHLINKYKCFRSRSNWSQILYLQSFPCTESHLNVEKLWFVYLEK